MATESVTSEKKADLIEVLAESIRAKRVGSEPGMYFDNPVAAQLVQQIADNIAAQVAARDLKEAIAAGKWGNVVPFRRRKED